MSASFGRWFRFEHLGAYGWSDEAIHSCYLGKVFYIWSHRNAWWGTDSNRYPADAFFPTLPAAKTAVEEMRTQGSQWQIHELPALVAVARDNYLAVTEINTPEPLAELVAVEGQLGSLEQVANALRPLSENSVIRLIGEPGLLTPAALPFRTHYPKSQGGKDKPFWWRSEISSNDLGSTLALITSVTQYLQTAGSTTGAVA